ncbi:MAG: hypothetical protein ICV60_13735 [Pyrinomonadaceae bacterium]|nr:hypothetical protein [Pyrinomonadaceae bacterium]
MVEYIHVNQAQKVLRLSCEKVLALLEKGEITGRPPRLLSASEGYDYCTGWLIERRSVEKYLAQHGRARRKPKTHKPEIHASLLAGNNSTPQVNTGF